jgi:molybdate transport system ATP-binding protein
VRCRIHASDVSLALTAPSDSSILNLLPATVVAVASLPTPGHALAQLKLHGDGAPRLLARITERSRAALGIAPGKAVVAQIKAVALLG